MPTVRPSGAGDEAVGAGEVRNGGTVIKGGGLTSESPMTRSIELSELADDQGQSYGSKVIAQDGNGGLYTDKVGISGAVPGAIVAGQTELGYKADGTEWVVQGGNVTQTLAGNAYTGLVGGAAGPDPTRDHINQLETTRAYGAVTIDPYAAPGSGNPSWNTKGVSPGGKNPGDLVNFVRPSGAGDENSSDDAANTTRAVPGELTYMFGGKLPQSDNYKARDSAE
jgi:hypothetical protein